MKTNDKRREQLAHLEKDKAELSEALKQLRHDQTRPVGQPYRERLREAIDTDREFVTVRNDDLYHLLLDYSNLERKRSL